VRAGHGFGFEYELRPRDILRNIMSAITLQLPDELALRLKGQEDRLPEILELGLREILGDQHEGFESVTEVLEGLASLPSAEDVLALRPSAKLSARVSELLLKNRDVGLDDQELREWERYEYLEHIVRIAKASASRRLTGSIADGRG